MIEDYGETPLIESLGIAGCILLVSREQKWQNKING